MSIWQFSKHFSLPKNGGHFEFSNFCQKWKNKFASISLTVQDRAISLKFSSQRVSQQTTICNSQKSLLSSKMAAILNFRIFAKNAKTLIYIDFHQIFRICLTQEDLKLQKLSLHNRLPSKLADGFMSLKNYPIMNK